MRQFVKVFFAIVFFLWGAGPGIAQELKFATAAEARDMLSARDEYFAVMSPFDRAARMKSGQEVSEADFVQYYASAALDWNDQEKARVRQAFEVIWPEIARLGLPLPEKIFFIKTSGREEADAAYTRGQAIVLPLSMLAVPDGELHRLIAHELFHVATRANPRLAGMMYEAIGFHRCGEVELPADLAARRISNPDTPRNEYCIQLKVGKEQVLAEPVLLASSAKYDTTRGGDFFDYLVPAYVLVQAQPGARTPRLLYDARGPRLVSERQVSGLYEQIGRNTAYTIQPEEVLADNFALLVTGQNNLPSPEVPQRMQRVLAKFAEAGKGMHATP